MRIKANIKRILKHRDGELTQIRALPMFPLIIFQFQNNNLLSITFFNQNATENWLFKTFNSWNRSKSFVVV